MLTLMRLPLLVLLVLQLSLPKKFPIFLYTAASVRYMARASWPGFTSEGALWFTDLTQQAMVMSQAGNCTK